MSYLRSFFGGAGATSQDDGEVVEKFVERLETASTAARLAVATMGMNLYMEVLHSEDDVEVVALTLDILNAVLADENGPLEDDELGDRLSEVIVKKAVFMPAILKWLDNEHFTIRKNAVQLLTTLLRHRAGEVQDAIIRDPTGTSRVVELLHEQREIIRNHVVLMLSELSRGNLQLQQLLVFQNCFQLLFTIIEQEPTDSIVIEDCLFVMLNLLKRNANNQQLFRENSLINRLHQLTGDFLYPREDADVTLESDWLPQKTANFIFILQVIRALVSPVDNAHANTHASQRCLLQTGLIDLLCRTFLSEVEVSTDVLTETAATLADVIRGNYANQNHFAASTVSTPEGTKWAFLPTSVQFFIFVQNLGQYLCASIISAESVQVWFGAVCLMHTLFDADHLKPQLLRVQLETMPGEEPSSLLAHIGDLLISLGARRLQTRCALLMLLSVWLHNCGQAVEEFVSKDAHIDYLTSHLVETNTELREGEDQVIKGLIAFLLGICVQHYENQDSGRKSKLIDVVNRRVGMEAVAECLEGVTKSEFYIRAAQKPMPTVGSPQDLLLEYQFCKLFKSLEGPLTKIFRPNGDFVASATNSDVVVASYKKLIKQQDEHIAELKQQVDHLKAAAEKTGRPVGHSALGRSMGCFPTADFRSSLLPTARRAAPKLAELQALRAENEELKRQLAEKSQQCVAYAGLWTQHEQLTQVLQQWQAEAERRKVWGEQWQSYQLAQLPDPTAAAVHQLQSQAGRTGHAAAAEVITALEQQKLENQQLGAELADVKQQLATSSHKELNATKNELETRKITGYRQRLRAHGEAVTDDEGETEEAAAHHEPEQPNSIV
ncbi:General vesicular transport factor [Aphelenchoides fujianensis]|nr:General vesicular transport factor [Aphelenchoides fujianensis]